MSIKKFIKEELEAENNGRPVKASQHLVDRTSIDFDTSCHSCVCGGCSCLCDDISYFLKDGKIIRTLNLCEVAMKRLHTVTDSGHLPAPTGAELAESINKAAGLIKANRPCLVLGADGMGESVIESSCRLAAKTCGIMLPWLYPDLHRFYSCASRLQWASALLDEVRDQADMVVMWRCDPLDTHHRHLSRYSLFARGRYTERGHSDRNFAAIASKKPFIERLCQQYFEMDNEKDVQFLLALMSPPQAEPPKLRDFSLIANAVTRCSYIAIFVDPAKMTDAGLETMFEWCGSINNEGKKRMIIMPLWAAGANTACFIQYCLESAGNPWGADFTGADVIGNLPASWDEIASKINSVIMIESGPEEGHRQKLPDAFSAKPKIIITPFKQRPETPAEIVIPVAMPGIETPDIFFRADGLPLIARKLPGIIPSRYPAAESILNKILIEAGP
ncbi:MAG: hypothetical protein MUC95_04030 [Spirochaetes bacterium]|nr:hypothetical protein [Spirochaetota bacterium]